MIKLWENFLLEMQWKTKALFLPWAIFHFYSVYSNYSLPKSQLNFNCAEMEISKANLYSFLVCTICFIQPKQADEKKKKKKTTNASQPRSPEKHSRLQLSTYSGALLDSES